VERYGKSARVLSKTGLDWTGAPRGSSKRPQIRLNRFIIDGEICVLDVQGISDFYTLHSGRHDDEAGSTPSTSW